jgi:DNA-binding transcriptional ArsR family regulator
MAAKRRAEPARQTEPGEAKPLNSSLKSLSGGVRESRDLDRLIHERVRLGIVSALAVTDSLSFTELRDLLETSDGNLSVHARKLEEGGYLDCRKYFEGRSPKTEYRLTDRGRQALQDYLGHMEALIAAVKQQH